MDSLEIERIQMNPVTFMLPTGQGCPTCNSWNVAFCFTPLSALKKAWSSPNTVFDFAVWRAGPLHKTLNCSMFARYVAARHLFCLRCNYRQFMLFIIVFRVVFCK
jgi:Zn-dependent alcohol dehydrogenase